jgi:hypothetical protein
VCACARARALLSRAAQSSGASDRHIPRIGCLVISQNKLADSESFLGEERRLTRWLAPTAWSVLPRGCRGALCDESPFVLTRSVQNANLHETKHSAKTGRLLCFDRRGPSRKLLPPTVLLCHENGSRCLVTEGKHTDAETEANISSVLVREVFTEPLPSNGNRVTFHRAFA